MGNCLAGLGKEQGYPKNVKKAYELINGNPAYSRASEMIWMRRVLANGLREPGTLRDAAKDVVQYINEVHRDGINEYYGITDLPTAEPSTGRRPLQQMPLAA